MRVLITILAVLAVGCAPQAPQDAAASAGPAAKPTQPPSTTLAEGTVLRVRTTSALSTKTHTVGDRFQATLEEALEDGGRVVVPKGALVEGRVVESDPGGRVKGRAELAVRLTQLHISEGKTVEIQTNTLGRAAQRTQKEDAAKIGIGAGVGAAIGAIAGGGKGAAIGAASGAGAGTGLVLATRGKAAVLPAESLLRFELRSPVTFAR